MDIRNSCDKKTIKQESGPLAHDSKPFKCHFAQCVKSFQTLGNFKMHLYTHLKEKPFKCALCPKTFAQKAGLELHVRRHTNTNLQKCDQCNKSFVSRNALKIHLITHTKISKFTCEFCSFAAPSNVALGNHVRARHLREKPFSCLECPQTFPGKSALLKHKIMVHGNRSEQFACTLCDYKCHWRSLLEKHSTNHQGSFKCVQCTFSYKSKAALTRHENKHCRKLIKTDTESEEYQELKPSFCVECGKQFEGDFLQKKLVRCQICERSMRQLVRNCQNGQGQGDFAILRKSDNSINDESESIFVKSEHIKFENENFLSIFEDKSCNVNDKDDCGDMKLEINIDEGLHGAVAIIICPFCDLTFGAQNEFGEHVTVHTKEKPWRCGCCNAEFTSKFDLDKHWLREHCKSNDWTELRYQPYVSLTAIGCPLFT